MSSSQNKPTKADEQMVGIYVLVRVSSPKSGGVNPLTLLRTGLILHVVCKFNDDITVNGQTAL